MDCTHARSWRWHHYVGAPEVTGNQAGDPPQLPHVILEAAPGVSEAEFRRDVDRMWALAARHSALLDAFSELHAATGPSVHKKTLTVLALMHFLVPDMPSASLRLVLNLFPPMAAKHYGNAMRGMIAAAVAMLRSADMENPRIEQWLSEEIKRRALDFQTGNAMRWFFDCNSDAAPVPPSALDAFRSFRPSRSLTEAEAKKQVVSMLNTVVAMKAGPLTQTPRRRG
jgi:hypothetical protein